MSRSGASTPSATPSRRGESPTDASLATAVFFICASLIVVAIVQWQSFETGLIVLTDGVQAALILIAATGFGLWLVALAGQGAAPLRWQILLAAGLGIGGLMLLVFGAGLLGLLNRGLWFALLIVMFAAGLFRVRFLLTQLPTTDPSPERKRRVQNAEPRTPRLRVTPIHWLWLLAMPALALTLLVAAVPPGFLWLEEARGYDVLEYHLGVPKEYALAGRITDLPHNVYAYFPFNVEMLYLLAMVLKGGPFSAVLLAKMLNAGLGVLTVAAVWLAGREFSRSAGVVAGVVAATMPWLTYLSGVCFVENGMLFFGALSVACLCRATTDLQHGNLSLVLTAGLLAGLSCGCKYTAVPMFALPLAIAWAVQPWPRRIVHLIQPCVFALGVLLTFTPWLAKNTVATGNPVFPLACSVFGANEDVWSEQQQAQWQAAHRPAPDQNTLAARLGAVWPRVLAEERFTWVPGAVFLLALVPLIGKRRWSDVTLIGLLLIQLAVWAFATHLYARFAVPILVPLAILCGRVITSFDGAVARGLVVTAVLGLGGANLYASARLYYHHLYVEGRLPAPAPHLEIAKRVDSWVNPIVPDDGYVLLVGDARGFYVRRRVDYCVVFSRNPFADAVAGAEGKPDAVLKWLRERGYTHVAVDWMEIDRLRKTYGFWPAINRHVFSELETAGLRVLQHVRQRDDGPLVRTVFEVPKL